MAAWVAGLTVLSWLLQIPVVALLGARGFAWPVLAQSLGECLTVSLLLFLTLPVVAWFAALGRGYLPPMPVMTMPFMK